MVFRSIASGLLIATLLAGVAVRADDPPRKMRAEDFLAREAAIDVLRSTSSNEQAKFDACRTLARIGPDAERADFLLIKLLQSPEPLRGAAADALRAIGPRAAPEMASEMRWVNAQLAQTLSELLISMGKDAAPAVPMLRNMLAYPQTDDRMLAMATLKGLGPVAKDAAPELERLIAADGLGERAMARVALHSVTRDAPPQEQERINKVIENIEALHNKFTSIPRGVEAVKELPALEHNVDVATSALLEAARIDDPVREAAIATLRSFGPAIVPKLVEHIRQNDLDAPTAEQVLAKMGPQAQGGIPDLVHLFRESNPPAAAAACRVLAGLGPFAASTADDLRLAMMDPNAGVRAEAMRALLSVTRDEDPIARAQIEEVCRPIENLRNGKSEQRVRACRTLQKLGQRANLAAYDLADALAGKLVDDSVSRAAADALRAIGSDAAGAIAFAIGDETHGDDRALSLVATLDEPTRRAMIAPLRRYLARVTYTGTPRACKAMAIMGPAASSSLDDLHNLVRDGYETVRQATVDAIIAIDPQIDADMLHGIVSLYDTDPLIHRRAIAAMERMAITYNPNGEILVDLIPLLTYADPSVRQSAQQMLLRAGGHEPALAARLHRFEEQTNAQIDPAIAASARLTMLIVQVRLDADNVSRNQLMRTLLNETTGDAMADGIAGAGPSAAPLFPMLSQTLQTPLLAPHDRSRLLRAIAGIVGGVDDRQEAAAALLPALDDPMPANRSSAMAGLSQLADAAKPALPRIVDLLRSREPSDVIGAAKAIAQLSPQAANDLPAIIQSLRRRLEAAPVFDDDSAIALRAACADALATLAPDSPDARDMLLLAVKRKDWPVRERLAPAIAKANQTPPALVNTLTALADRSPEELVRINARCALRELGEHAPGDAW